MSSPLTVPVDLRVHLAHATLQAITEASETHLLHIKDPATDHRLRDPGKRGSVDADVLIRAGCSRFEGEQTVTMTKPNLEREDRRRR